MVPVVAQTDASMPYTYGDAEIDVSDIDAFLSCREPLGSPHGQQPASGAASPGLERLGRLVSARVPDGAVLQLGIGRVPDAVLPGLLERRGLGVWRSEMVSDGVLALEHCRRPVEISH